MTKRIFRFGGNSTDTVDEKQIKQILGGKGAGLAQMSRLGVKVPPGFIVTTDVCREYFKGGDKMPAGLTDEIKTSIRELGKVVGRAWGNPKDPLLVSVRSGAPVSMPGMMDTILNLGLTYAGVSRLAELTNNPRFAWDLYRRFVQMFGEIVLEAPADDFEHLLAEERKKANVDNDSKLPPETLRKISDRFLAIVKEKTGKEIPDDPDRQLLMAVEAVFRSWNNRRANKYREIHGIPHDIGTAVNVQTMVYGNRSDDSGSGVLFTRNPATGEKGLFGEYLLNAQGEDIVAGIRTPLPINARSAGASYKGATLEKEFPHIYKELDTTVENLEKHYREMQDIEFTIEQSKLWILQTRTGKRTARAALRVAMDLVAEKRIDKKEALLRIRPRELDQLLHPVFDAKAPRHAVAKGLPASPGAAAGKIVFNADDAEKLAQKGERVLLVREETSPEDIHGMQAAQGILTARGGMTSHAAVVARGMGKTCVVGCDEITIDGKAKVLVARNGETFPEGTVMSLDGTSGELLKGEMPTVPSGFDELMETFLAWADEVKTLGVRANADTPKDCEVARKHGAQGVGLTRTEHMFFEKDRIDHVRQMILAETQDERMKPIEKIFKMQLEDFKGIFYAMRGYPVTIRLLDPPLHEFLPQHRPEIEVLAKRLNLNADELEKRIGKLHEFNPMLGHRGCRLGITFPEIYDMQVRAIVTAAIEVSREVKEKILPEIMIPLTMDEKEFRILKERTVEIAEDLKKKHNSDLTYLVGTMIELPRAALRAEQIAKEAEFFSFGTNDLTQTTLGLSRDDSGRFLGAYVEKGIFPEDPFASIDAGGVLELVQMGTDRGRKGNPKLKVGVCGEHGGDPASIAHFHKVGLAYVSCSPMRVPIARLAAAQAALKG